MQRQVSLISVLGQCMLLVVASWGQTAEVGKAFNRFMSPQSGINTLSGTVAFSKSLTQISSGGVSASFDLAYSGNIFREVQTRNDKSPGSWVGLGWALGKSNITCEHHGTIQPDDDTYYLSTPTGAKYKIFEANGKWWVEQHPYWKVERIAKQVTWQAVSYTLVVGWKIIDEAGLISFYGDYTEDPNNPEKNATQPLPSKTA